MTSKVEKIDEFFPATSNDTILKFLSNDDGKFEARQAAFEAYLSGLADPLGKHTKTFSDSLKDLLFDRDYVAQHKWVFSRYIYTYIILIIIF